MPAPSTTVAPSTGPWRRVFSGTPTVSGWIGVLVYGALVTVGFAAQVGLFGVFACLLLRLTGNLWMPIGFHAAWNWGQTFLFGVSDSGHAAAPGHFFTASVSTSAPEWLSGGATGPEGSALCVALIATLILGLALYRRQTPASPPYAREESAEPTPPPGA